MSSILLMDPYRAALVSMALEERLITPPQVPSAHQNAFLGSFRMGEDKDIRATVLQQLLLFDEPLIIQHEERGTAAENAAKGIIELSLRNLHEENIVTFVQGKIAVPDWGDDWTKCWIEIEQQLSTLRSWMVDQLMSRSYVGHPSVYDCWFEAQHRACASVRGELVDDAPLTAALAKVPAEWRAQALEVARNNHSSARLLLLVINRLGEMWQAGAIAQEQEIYASVPHLDIPRSKGGAEDSGVLIEIVIRELLANNIMFRLPSTLREARDLRRDPAVVSFRECFLPWLGALKSGDASNERRLVREVSLSAKSYKLSTIAKDISEWSTIASIALEAFGLQSVPAIASYGFDVLTGRAGSKSKWVGLCGREKKNSVTQLEMAAADRRVKKARDARPQRGQG